MTQPTTIGRESWRLRSVPQTLADRYRAEGWWTDASLGQMVADASAAWGTWGSTASSTSSFPRAARHRSPAPVCHFIGMLNAFPAPMLRDRPVNLIDVWEPGEVLRMMRDEGLGMGGGATYFLTSLLDHPDFTDEHSA